MSEVIKMHNVLEGGERFLLSHGDGGGLSKELIKKILTVLHSHPLGRKACCIGEARAGNGKVLVNISVGGTRNLDLFAGAVLPRIC